MTISPHFPWTKKYPASVDWAMKIVPRPLYEIFDDAVRDFPDNIFIDFLGKTYTYRETDGLVMRAAKGLQDFGIKKGDRVGLMLPNSPYYPILYFAALKLGAIIVNFNPLYAAKEVERQVKDSGCRIVAVIDVPEIYTKLSPLAGQTCLEKIILCPMSEILPTFKSYLYPILKYKNIVRAPEDARHLHFLSLVANDGKFMPAIIDPDKDVAVLQYTGGTTGIPKGAVLTHANLSINVVQFVPFFPKITRGQESLLGVLPFFHVFGLTAGLNITVLLAGKLIMLPRFELRQVLKIIHKKHPTLFVGVPTIYTAINNFKNLKNYNLRSIKYCISGGAPLPVEVKEAFERAADCAINEGYGLSETSPVVACNPGGMSKSGSIGLPIPGTIIELVDIEDKKTLVPQGKPGEICVRGPQVMKEYWHQADETANVMDQTPDGPRLHTGDVGFMDEDGYTFIIDRIKDMITSGGFKIYPRHVEEAIYQHPAVEKCIVAGIPDSYRGQAVKAFIKLRAEQTLNPAELKKFLEDKISPIEMPRFIDFRDSLPKTLIGKLSRKMILEEEAARK